MVGGLILGIDFGTSNTVAVLGGPGRPVIRMIFDGSFKLPSGVYALDGSTLLTGRDAVQASHTHPERYVAHPKSKMADQYIALGPHEFTPVDLVAAVFRRVLTEANRTAQNEIPPQDITETVITYPEYWRAGRIQALKTAAHSVGIPRPRLIKEPVAAATRLNLTKYANLRDDRSVVIYDLGAGTFDASVVRREKSGYEVVGDGAGLPGVAGLALDRAVASYLARQVMGKDPAAAERVEHPSNNPDRIETQLFMNRVREARETLSSRTSVQIYFPHHEEMTLTRDRFEDLAEPILQQTVDRTKDLISDAGLAISDIDRVFLVGGASQTPLVAVLLERELNRPVILLPDPEQVVAEGSISGASSAPPPTRRSASPGRGPVITPSPPTSTGTPTVAPAPEDRRAGHRPRDRVLRYAAGVLAVLIAAAGGVTVGMWQPWERSSGHALPTSPTTAVPVPGDGVLHIGALMGLSGTLAELDEGPYAGFDLAIQDINDAGGVNGRDVEGLRTDSGDSADEASEAVGVLLARKVDVVIGTTSSSLTLSVIDQITGAGVVEISPNNTALRLTDYQDHGLYFRTAPPDTFQGRVLADLAVRDSKRTICILIRRDEYGKGLAAIVQVALEQASVRVVPVEYAGDDKDFSQEVATLKKANPDAVIMIGFDETRKIVQELVKNNITTRNTSWYLADGNIADYSGSLPPGTMAGTKATLPGARVTDEFKARLRTIKPDIKNFASAPEGYDSTVLAALAAVEARSDNPAEIAKHLIPVSKTGQKCFTFRACRDLIVEGKDIDYDGFSGKIEFNAAGDPGEATIGVYLYDTENSYSNVRYVTTIL